MDSHATDSPASRVLLDAGRHPLAARVSWNLGHRCGLGSRDRFALALSGGADSTAALAILAALSHREGAPMLVAAIHVHHHLRPSADNDAAVAAEACRSMGVPFVRKDIEVPRDGNLMARAREARYLALSEAAAASGANVVVTAHHADDQVESLLMQVFRGDRPPYPGTAWARPMGTGSAGVALARPFLDVSRAELRECAFALGLEWAEDPSNLDPARRRARLRLDVMPPLHAIFGNGTAHAAAYAHLMQDWAAIAREHMQRMVGAGPVWDRRLLARISPELLTWWLGQTVESSVPEATLRAIVRALRDDSDAPRQWNGWALDGRTLSHLQPD
ncbi:MAG: tRNA lysidine(34) synthetase TilS [Planctomycetota bacterium]|nr:tRNA lysidine(34) synthetase TilS [Planctomycetota bacterium]MDA1105057.1 tRNA lysidine(34) synthetase TilS [Planctomycetota bacterium]